VDVINDGTQERMRLISEKQLPSPPVSGRIFIVGGVATYFSSLAILRGANEKQVLLRDIFSDASREIKFIIGSNGSYHEILQIRGTRTLGELVPQADSRCYGDWVSAERARRRMAINKMNA
tara:strand:- start:1864 stop:2226 length:363 start_codon:yes stop_codon:yes gene_type:complete